MTNDQTMKNLPLEEVAAPCDQEAHAAALRAIRAETAALTGHYRQVSVTRMREWVEDGRDPAEMLRLMRRENGKHLQTVPPTEASAVRMLMAEGLNAADEAAEEALRQC
jgi:hypothetical protein